MSVPFIPLLLQLGRLEGELVSAGKESSEESPAEGSKWGTQEKNTITEGFQAELTALGLEGHR